MISMLKKSVCSLLAPLLLAGLSFSVSAVQAQAPGSIQTALATINDQSVEGECPALFRHQMKRLHSSEIVDLCEVTKGRPVLLVNTASHCGFTHQFEDLEAIHQAFKDRGLVVVGVSSDSFYQEADSEAEAADVCFKNFGVSFTMLATVPVRGQDAHPLFRMVGEAAGYPKWNFYKYLINPQGEIVASWSSIGLPSGQELSPAFTF